MKNKFTDEEVIKALECCVNAETKRDCEVGGCPALTEHGCYFYLRTNRVDENALCIELLNEGINLINRQKAEIESLKKILHELKMEAEMVYKQRDSLKNQVNLLKKYDAERDIKLHARLTANARTEAIKEFAERLKKEIKTDYINGTREHSLSVINQIEKRNDGGQNEKMKDII